MFIRITRTVTALSFVGLTIAGCSAAPTGQAHTTQATGQKHLVTADGAPIQLAANTQAQQPTPAPALGAGDGLGQAVFNRYAASVQQRERRLVTSRQARAADTEPALTPSRASDPALSPNPSSDRLDQYLRSLISERQSNGLQTNQRF
jgi:hypothetical protein